MKTFQEMMQVEGGPTREEVQAAFDRVGAQLDEVVAAVEATGDKVPPAMCLFAPADIAMVLLECSLQRDVISELDSHNNRSAVLLEACRCRLLARNAQIKELNAQTDSLLSTIYQTWCYLGKYTSDSDDATHAKRLLQNCLLARGSDATKAVVRKKLLAPKRRTLFSVLLDYNLFGWGLCGVTVALGHGHMYWAVWCLIFSAWSAVDIAKEAAKGVQHVQA